MQKIHFSLYSMLLSLKNFLKKHFYLRCESTELPTSCGINFQMACMAPWRGLETRGRTGRGFLEGIFHAAGEAEALPVLMAKKRRPKRVSGRQRNQGPCVKALQSLEGTLHLLGAEAGRKRKICLWCFPNRNQLGTDSQQEVLIEVGAAPVPLESPSLENVKLYTLHGSKTAPSCSQLTAPEF